jgi:hypothetical protein
VRIFLRLLVPYLNPMGSKGIGEIGIVGTAAAVTNAVHHRDRGPLPASADPSRSGRESAVDDGRPQHVSGAARPESKTYRSTNFLEGVMEIGKPKRVYRVEPLRDPVPKREAPAPSPAREAPKPTPAR